MNKIKKTKLLTTLALATTAMAMLGVGAIVSADDTAFIASAQDNATVTVAVGEEVTTHSYFDSALQYANGYESAKITLVADTVDGTNSKTIETNLTLDLAGKEMNNAFFGFSLEPSKPASLVIEDSSGNNAGRLSPGSGVVLSSLNSGSITINGGTLINAGICIGNENGVLTVNGGVFEGYLDIIAEAGTATINDGVFEGGFFGFYDGGEIFVKGGSYKSLNIRNGEFADVLADGYALKNSAGEYEDINSDYIIDYTCDSENEQWIYHDEYTVVEHICEIGYQINETQHWIACACFRGEPTAEKDNHTGGTAACTEKAVCDICEKEYGAEPMGHILGGDGNCTGCGEEIAFVVEWDDAVTYYLEMPALWKFKFGTGKLLADVTVEEAMSTGSGGYSTLDLNGYTVRVAEEATVANALFNASSEDSFLAIIDSSEEKTGAIDYDGVIFGGQGEIRVENCIFSDGIRVENMCIMDILAAGTCFGEAVVAGEATEFTTAITIAPHAYETQANETQHWTACDCGEETEKDNHTGGEATCTDKAICSECLQGYGELDEHVTDSPWRKNETHHWNGCIYGAEGGNCTEKFNYGEHADDDDNGECDTCEMEMQTQDDSVSDGTNGNAGSVGSVSEEADEGCGGSATDAMAGILGVLGLSVVAVIIRRRKISS